VIGEMTQLCGVAAFLRRTVSVDDVRHFATHDRPGCPLCQRSCRLDRMGTFGGADSSKWLDTDKRTKIG
jgi:hypothetical protein